MDRDDDADKDEDKPSLRQKLSWAPATVKGGEASPIARPGVTKHDAKVAVARAHGDDGVAPPEVDEPAPEDEIASPEDAETVKEERKR